MDPRRRLTLTFAGLALAGCAALRPGLACDAAEAAAALPSASAPVTQMPPARPRKAAFTIMAPVPNPPSRGKRSRSAPAGERGRPAAAAVALSQAPSGRSAIAAANLRARQRSRAEAFVGGVQVFAYQPGRVYEIWTAPLRVTTLTLGRGETIVAKAAGDTVRWQIGETTSGEGEGRRAHVMIKPLRRGLETNLVLTTSRRIYLIQLKSGPPEAFNAAVAWDAEAVKQAPPPAPSTAAPPPSRPVVAPTGPLDARFRIVPRGRRPAWTPLAVITDGVRTFLSFPPDLAAHDAPALFVIGPAGEPQIVNYRQQAGLWVVDRVFDEAELRLGGKRGQSVRIIRSGDRP